MLTGRVDSVHKREHAVCIAIGIALTSASALHRQPPNTHPRRQSIFQIFQGELYVKDGMCVRQVLRDRSLVAARIRGKLK